MKKEFDVILYGATGFTGKQTVQYFAEHVKDSLHWAIAGRNLSKLEVLRQGLGEKFKDLPIVVADSQNEEAVEEMVANTRVILTTAGPFAKYGKPIVKACVKYSTDYVDITGETPFVKYLVDTYHEEALEKGVKIVPFCGFDSVPSDLGTYLLVRETQNKFQEDIVWAKGYFNVFGGFNGGTIASMINMIESGEMKTLNNPDLLTPLASGSKARKDNWLMKFDPHFYVWTAPFFMAPVNTRVVRRSFGLFSQKNLSYGSEFSYDECMYFDEIIPFQTSIMTGILNVLNGVGRMASTATLMKKVLPSPGTGPSQKLMDKGYVKCWLLGKTTSGRIVKTYLYSKGDPGNKVTVKILCESALALALQRNELPETFAGGVLTPATAFGEVLIERLRQAGMTLDYRA